MRQRLFVSAVFVLLTGACYAQWTKEDSLRLKKSLKEGEELKLNKEAVRQIDLNAGAANPRVYEEKRWMRFDESLPRVISPSAVVESDTLYDKRRITGGKLPLQMQVFTRECWQFRKKRMRARTMGVLEEYRKQR